MPDLALFFEEQYLPYVQGYKRSWALDNAMFNNKIKPVWGNMKLSEISRQDIEQFKTNLIKAGYKPATTNRYMALVKYIFSLAEKWEVIDKSPARQISKLEENNIIERYLTAQETDNLLRELKLCEHTVVPDLIEFLILTGARKSEAKNAEWKYMDFENCIWTVPISKSGHARPIVLSKGAIKILDRRQSLAKESPYVFGNTDTGLPITNFYRIWDKIRNNAGIATTRLFTQDSAMELNLLLTFLPQLLMKHCLTLRLLTPCWLRMRGHL